jgi:hypothetical protein
MEPEHYYNTHSSSSLASTVKKLKAADSVTHYLERTYFNIILTYLSELVSWHFPTKRLVSFLILLLHTA